MLSLFLPLCGFGRDVDLLLTADTRGRVFACRTCPAEKARGGLAHAAGVVESLREQHPDALLLDAGNALTGGELPPDRFDALAELLQAMDYGAINLSAGDFRHGADVLLRNLASFPLPVISANIVSAESGERFFPAFLTLDGVRVIGLTESPPGRELLPHVRRQLEGVDIRDPSAVLREQLAENGTGPVVVLYHGGPGGLRGLRSVVEDHPDRVVRVVAAGLRKWEVPEGMPVIHVPDGEHVARVPPGKTSEPRRLPVTGDARPPERIRRILDSHDIRKTRVDASPEPGEDSARISPEALVEGLSHAKTLTASNRGIGLTVHELGLVKSLEGIEAPEGSLWLALDASFRNRQPIDLLLEMEYEDALLIGNLPRQLFLVVNDRIVRSLARPMDRFGLAMPEKFKLISPGSRRRGRLVFEVPEEGMKALSLHVHHDKFPPLVLPLAGPFPPEKKAEPLTPVLENAIADIAVYGFNLRKEYNGRTAPAGLVYAAVDLRGRSRRSLEGDARALDAEAAPDARADIPQVMEYLKAPRLLQLVVDGEYMYTRLPETGSLQDVPVFLPEIAAGGRAVFLVPENAESVELYCGFPRFQETTGRDLGTPEALDFALKGPAVDPAPRQARAVLKDTPVPVAVTGSRTAETHGAFEAGAGRELLVISLSARNESEEGGMYEVSSRVTLETDAGQEGEPLAVTGRGGAPLLEPLWLPAGKRRSFELLYSVAAGTERASLHYAGVSAFGKLDVSQEPGHAVADAGKDARTHPMETAEVVTETGPDGGNGVAAPSAFPSVPLRNSAAIGWEPVVWEASDKENPDRIVMRPPGGGRPVNQTLRAGDVNLQVHRLIPLSGYYGETPDEGRMLLAVELELSRAGDAGSVKLEDVGDRFPIRINGRRLVQRSWFGGTNPQLEDELTLDGDNPSVRRFLLYDIPADGVGSVDLVYAPATGAASLVSLVPRAGNDPHADPSKTLRNRVARLEIHGAEIRERFNGRAPDNGAWLVADLRGESRLHLPEADGEFEPLPLTWRGWRPRLQLVVDGVRTWTLGRKAFLFDDKARLLPGVRSGGLFAFDVSPDMLKEASVVELQCGFTPTALPGHRVVSPVTLMFALKGDPADLPPPPEPKIRVTDLPVELEIISISKPGDIGERDVEAGHTGLRLDLAVTGRLDRGVLFKPADWLELIGPDRSIMRPHRYTWRGPEAPPNRGYATWIPKGGRREFSMFWEVADDHAPVRLRINGIRHYKAVDLFPGADVSPDPEADRLISEQGVRVLNPGSEPAGIAGVGLTPAQVNQAIDRGREFLWGEVRKELSSGRRSLHGEFFPALLALVHCDAHLEIPDFDRMLRRLIRESRVEQNTVYENALLAMTIEGYGDPSFLPKMEQIAHWLVETQGEAGTWSYSASAPARFFPEPETDKEPDQEAVLRIVGGERREKVAPPEEPVYRTQSWETGKNGDHSCTQFAVLGLWSAERAGVPIDDEVWERVLTRMSRHQTLGKEDEFGGFGYNGPGGAYGSMTGAGICVLAIAQNRLFDELTPRHHLRIRNALGWLVRNFTVTENPGSKKYNFYYLYSIERVGRILGIDFMGGHEWYPQGAKYLVGTQNGDGSWPSGPSEGDPVLTSSYALLFLTRATPELSAEPEPEPTGPGILATVVERPGIRHQVYLILDASGSMRPEIEGKAKLDIAREAVGDLLDVLPKGTRVAVRAYGHRKRAIEPGADEDTELVVPWTDLDPVAVRRALDALRPMGTTPMALSLSEAAGDIRGGGEDRSLLVLLTDGGEDNRDTDPVAAAAAFADRENVEFFILGFDINRPDWTRQLKSMAAAGKGVYRPVDDASALARDLKAVVYPPVPEFRVLDGDGAEVVSSTFGSDPLELPEGDYTVQAPGFSAGFHIRAGGTTRITLDMANLPQGDGPSAAPAEPDRDPADQAPASAGPTFCTQCGNKLAPAAKFCTSCGAPVL